MIGGKKEVLSRDEHLQEDMPKGAALVVVKILLWSQREGL